MNWKILFVLLAVILLSSSVFAGDENVKHTTRSGQTPQMSPSYKAYMQQAGGYVGAAVVAAVSGNFIQAGIALHEAKRSYAKAQEYRLTIQQRGAYVFYDFVGAYEDWTGFNKYGALFYTEDGLARRREMAADYFCERVFGLLGGKDCWRSRLCEPFYHARDMPAGRSVLVAQQGVGGFLPAVSVQGEKSLPIAYKEAGKSKTKYVYKITYAIANPNNRQMAYHVKLIGAANTWESDAMTIQAATETEIFRDDRLGGNPFMTESEHDYNTVCLAFSPRIRTSSWNYVSELCSPLVQYGGAATMPYAPTPANATS